MQRIQEPQFKNNCRIAIINGANKVLVHGLQELLFTILRKHGINVTTSLILNPFLGLDLPDEKSKKLAHLPAERHQEIEEVLEQYKPNIVLSLGRFAMQLFFPDRTLETWRGSLGQVGSQKHISTFHPSTVVKRWDTHPLFKFDLARAAAESASPQLILPKRNFQLDLTCDQTIALLESVTDIASPVAMDIEGYVTGVTCCSIATSPTECFIVAFSSFTLSERQAVWVVFTRFCRSTTPKILQNHLYDNFVLSWTYKCPINNVIWDTMLSGWEIYPELPKGLGTQVSIYTREPFYKSDRHNPHLKFEYCCKDSACTYEIYLEHKKILEAKPKALAHFRFNMSLLPGMLYMQLTGFNYAHNQKGLAITEFETIRAQFERSIMTYLEEKFPGKARPNLASPQQLADLLYVQLKYPKQHPKVAGLVDRNSVTTDIDAILNLKATFTGPTDAILEDLLQWRKATKILQSLNMGTDTDGRIRCNYNIVGTETGRLTCSKSNTGSGGNLTTVTKKLRHLYLADPGYYLFQCDLSGADGWTIAAYCASLGDRTMLDDYWYQIKPAQVIVLMYQHGSVVNTWSRDQIKSASVNIKESDPEWGMWYFAAKRVQHGTNYLLGKNTMSDQILKDSYKLLGKTLVVKPTDCVKLQNLYLSRYPGVRSYQSLVSDTIDSTSQLGCASGHVRRFFGRKKNNVTYREACAHEPQANTTYVTNLALYHCLHDPTNRNPNGSYIIQPKHHVHDAFIGQFPIDRVEWSIERITAWFNNPITVAGITFTIPFEGAYGPSWGNLSTGRI